MNITISEKLAKALDKAAFAGTPWTERFALLVGGTITKFYWAHDDEFWDDLHIDVLDPSCGQRDSLIVASVEACEESQPYDYRQAPFVKLLGVEPESYL